MGIDPSLTHTGVMAIDGDEFKARRVIESKPTGLMVGHRMQRIHDIVATVQSICESTRPEVICIEHYSFASKTPVSDRIELGGLLRYVLWRDGYKVYEVAPATLKKHACGKGKHPATGKTPIIVALTHRYGVQFETDDEYDAYGLARMASQIAGYEQCINDAQREAITTVTAEKIRKTRKTRKEKGE